MNYFRGSLATNSILYDFYLTGLNVSKDLMEAARLDGAKGLKMLWHVVLPQLRPATFISVVVTVIGALRSFDMVAIMTEGGPMALLMFLHIICMRQLFQSMDLDSDMVLQ